MRSIGTQADVRAVSGGWREVFHASNGGKNKTGYGRELP